MSPIRKLTVSLICAGCMLLLILDSQKVVIEISKAIEMCLRTVVPSLFPFIFLSAILSNTLLGTNIPGIHFLSRLLKIPSGGEFILISSFLGGYPVGAKTLGEAYSRGALDRTTACRMLAYSSNAGPAFLFGMIGPLFSSPIYAWIIWIIHILSAVITGLILPKPTQNTINYRNNNTLPVTQILQDSMRAAGSICGWILIFKLFLYYIAKPAALIPIKGVTVYLTGFMEISNGCLMVNKLSDTAKKFFLCSCFISFGGLCVTLQTASVIKDLPISAYLLGKLIQLNICIILTTLISIPMFHSVSITGMLLRLLITLPVLWTLYRLFIKKYGNCGYSIV